MANTESFEAIYRMADFLQKESDRDGVHHNMGFLALANYLKHSGYKNTHGDVYEDGHAKAMAVVVDHCWDYVKSEYGDDEAEKVYLAFCDKYGKNLTRRY